MPASPLRRNATGAPGHNHCAGDSNLYRFCMKCVALITGASRMISSDT
jgi:hypothetical protein